MGKAEDIIEALGGAENIEEIEACATRLRTVVNDPSLVNEKALKSAGAASVSAAVLARAGQGEPVVMSPSAGVDRQEGNA